MPQPRGPGFVHTVAEPFPILEGPSHEAPFERSPKPLEPDPPLEADPPTYPSGAFPDYATPYDNNSHQGGAVTTSQPDALQVAPQQPAVPDIEDYMAINVFYMLCCCLPVGIVAVVISNQCKQAKTDGDFPKAGELSLQAKNWGTVTLACGMICIVIVVLIFFYYYLHEYIAIIYKDEYFIKQFCSSC